MTELSIKNCFTVKKVNICQYVEILNINIIYFTTMNNRQNNRYRESHVFIVYYMPFYGSANEK